MRLNTTITGQFGGLLAFFLTLACGVYAQLPSSASTGQLQSAPPPQQTGPRALSPDGGHYSLRARDTITLGYRLTPEFNHIVAAIQPDGFVSLPLTGEVHASGLTLQESHELVLERASVHLKDPEVNISLKEFERPYVVVAGEVPHPGRFDFYQKSTALQAVLQADGFSASAQQSDVYVFRRIDGDLAEVHTLNLKGMKKSHDLHRDLVLQPET